MCILSVRPYCSIPLYSSEVKLLRQFEVIFKGEMAGLKF